MNLLPVNLEYQYFLGSHQSRQYLGWSHLLVDTAQHEVEEYEEESHARGAPDADVEPSVVREDPLLVVLGELVETGTSDGRLDCEVPSTELVSHDQHITLVEMLCTGVR